MEVTTKRLMDPSYLSLHAVQMLFHNAFSGAALFPNGFEGMVDEIVEIVADPDNFVLIGLEDDIPKALLIILLPKSRRTPFPQIFHIYNSGGHALRKNLIKTGKALVLGAGYTKIWAVNGSGAPDSVWARTFRLAGPAKPIGGLVEFDLGATPPGDKT